MGDTRKVWSSAFRRRNGRIRQGVGHFPVRWDMERLRRLKAGLRTQGPRAPSGTPPADLSVSAFLWVFCTPSWRFHLRFPE